MESAVTPKKLAIIAAFVLATLLALVSLIFLTSPGYDWRAPRSAARDYQTVALGVIVEDLERNNVLPRGTNWDDPELKNRRVTVSWFLSRDRVVLERIAEAGDVVIRFPMGHHGEVWAPITIARTTQHGLAGVEPQPAGDMPYAGVR